LRNSTTFSSTTIRNTRSYRRNIDSHNFNCAAVRQRSKS
jgi:hypothetical protein